MTALPRPQAPLPEAELVDHETAAPERRELRLWLRLLTCVTLIESEIRAKLRTEFDTTLPRFDYLAALDKAEGPLTMGELSRRLMVSNGNITGVTDRLVEEGLVTRRQLPGDRRTQLIALTEQGRQSFEAMAVRHAEWMSRAFAGLTRAESDQLMELLAKTKSSVRHGLMEE